MGILSSIKILPGYRISKLASLNCIINS